MRRSEITIDLDAVRDNARRLLEVLDGAELWAVVKANGYGHGAADVGAAALDAGASSLCVATVAEGLALRRVLGGARIVVLGPAGDVDAAREARLDAARCGIALYGLSPFGADPADDGLRPVLSWRSELVEVRRLAAGESTGYGRRFIAIADTWIGLVPIGYADGFRRDLTGTQVLVAGKRCRVVGRVSMDSFAVSLPGELAVGTPVTLIGDGLLAEEHARIADTITYELVSRIESGPERATRIVAGA